jgi:hypothetical protein
MIVHAVVLSKIKPKASGKTRLGREYAEYMALKYQGKESSPSPEYDKR